ncbi:hypothetical protein GGI07_005671 [Coemansia sp. Benny D115]|nr:hypothetical protein GGI07_005671 [Coemansia sp. Benny D115]
MSSSTHLNQRRSSSALSLSRPDSLASMHTPPKQPHRGKQQRGQGSKPVLKQQTPRPKQQPSRGKQNNSNQRKEVEASDEEEAHSSKSRRRKSAKQQPVLLTRQTPEHEKQALLAELAAPERPSKGDRQAAKKRNRRRHTEPPLEDEAIVYSPPASRTTPRRQQQQQARQPVVMHAPKAMHPWTAPLGAPGHGSAPARLGSPARSGGHYAGASFANSPAANTLPLPSSFMASPTKVTPPVRMDALSPTQLHQQPVYHGTSVPVQVSLSERSRQLESMLRGSLAIPVTPPAQNYDGGYAASRSTIDLGATNDMAAMFQKLRLIRNLSQTRPATVAPTLSTGLLGSTQLGVAPVYNA